MELVKTGGRWPKANDWCPHVTTEAGEGVMHAWATGRQGSRQTAEGEEAGPELREQANTEQTSVSFCS